MTKSELIKKLRDMTQAGVMDAKKALDENQDNLDKAVQWLKERGIAKAAKKAGAIAADGIVDIVIHGNYAAMFEINSQTDFVAKNEHFINLVSQIKLKISEFKPTAVDEVYKIKLDNGSTVEEEMKQLIAKIGENIVLRRLVVVEKKDNESFASYRHSNSKIGVLLLLSTNNVDPEVGKNIAMHAAAMNPRFLNKTQVNSDWLENEKKALRAQTIKEGKPADRIEAIVNGRVNKVLAENCLCEQTYVKDPSKTVAQYAKQHNCDILTYIRFEVGEGIEKKEVNFAEEVAAQMNS